jgi:hypothetical protein
VTDPKWALGYLEDRVAGFRRGNLPLAAVRTATKIALRANVPLVVIAARLASCGLRLDTRGDLSVVPLNARHEFGE